MDHQGSPRFISSNDPVIIKKKIMLNAAYRETIRLLGATDNEDISLDTYLLMDVIRNAELDIQAMTSRNPDLHPDAHKRCAHYTYWISKIKPISIVNYQIYWDRPVFTLHANELFSMIFSFSEINAAIQSKLETKLVTQPEHVTPFDKRVLNINQMKVTIRDFLINLSRSLFSAETLFVPYYYLDITAGNTPYLMAAGIIPRQENSA